MWTLLPSQTYMGVLVFISTKEENYLHARIFSHVHCPGFTEQKKKSGGVGIQVLWISSSVISPGYGPGHRVPWGGKDRDEEVGGDVALTLSQATGLHQHCSSLRSHQHCQVQSSVFRSYWGGCPPLGERFTSDHITNHSTWLELFSHREDRTIWASNQGMTNAGRWCWY